jgi:nucleotidyltransferase AbiEii toxin of type IV toxin-antitoxin system
VEASTLLQISRLSAREWSLIAAARGVAMEQTPDKLEALVDVVQALDRLGAPHALVGGVAVGLRSGVPRATVDTNIAIPSTVARSSIVEALTATGLRLTGTFSHSLNFRHSSGEPVQIVIDPAFDAMIDRAAPLEFGGVRIRVVTTADLIAMKERAAADPARRRSKALRDQADVALLRGDVPTPTRAGDLTRPLINPIGSCKISCVYPELAPADTCAREFCRSEDSTSGCEYRNAGC